MRVAYGKLGRSIPLTKDEASNVGGDIEVIQLLNKLVALGHEVHIVGRNRGESVELNGGVNHWAPGGLFYDAPEASRHKDPTFDAYDAFLKDRVRRLPAFDAVVIWLGQHGSSVHPVPAVQDGKKGTWTNPMASDVNYGYPLVALVNELNVKPIWLCPDPRNMVKFRDLWNPKQRTILAQFNTSKPNTFYDERDCTLRSGSTRYDYAAIEMLAVQPVHCESYTRAMPPQLFGILVNEGYNNLGEKSRVNIIKTWVLDVVGRDIEIFGTWSDASQKKLDMAISPVPLSSVMRTLQRWRATITLPATGGGWATAKPWECFAAGTVCFKHPDYDSQDHIYSRRYMPEELRTFLCPPTTTGLKRRLEELRNEDTWRRFIGMQWKYAVDAFVREDGGMARLRKEMRKMEAGE